MGVNPWGAEGQLSMGHVINPLTWQRVDFIWPAASARDCFLKTRQLRSLAHVWGRENPQINMPIGLLVVCIPPSVALMLTNGNM
jgi:hypothetical protein